MRPRLSCEGRECRTIRYIISGRFNLLQLRHSHLSELLSAVTPTTGKHIFVHRGISYYHCDRGLMAEVTSHPVCNQSILDQHGGDTAPGRARARAPPIFCWSRCQLVRRIVVSSGNDQWVLPFREGDMWVAPRYPTHRCNF